LPFGSKIYVNTRTPIAYAERIVNEEKILGFVDKDGMFIDKQNVDEKILNKFNMQVFGWQEKFKKILSEILIAQDNYKFELIKISFSQNGFLTLEEKDLKTIFLGFNPNLINYQLQIINNLKNEFKKNNFPEKIDNIDLTDPNKPKIKVFKP
jgi:cell division protein FtsQ